MNVLIRCIEAAEKSTQVIAQNAGDYYRNKDAARRLWSAALRAYDESSETTKHETEERWPGTRRYMVQQVERHSYVGD